MPSLRSSHSGTGGLKQIANPVAAREVPECYVVFVNDEKVVTALVADVTSAGMTRAKHDMN